MSVFVLSVLVCPGLLLSVSDRLEGVPGLHDSLPCQLRGDLNVVAGARLQAVKPGVVLGDGLVLQQMVLAETTPQVNSCNC